MILCLRLFLISYEVLFFYNPPTILTKGCTMAHKKIMASFTLFGLMISANAADISISTYGRLGAIGSFDFSGSKSSYAGTLAHLGADFSLTNGFKWGLGAIGAWAAWQDSRYGTNSTLPYEGGGDASEAYVGFKNRLISFYAGRFKNDFMKFDWLQGNVQGFSLRFSTYEDKASYWITYANSYLYNGKQHNYIQGDRIAGDLTTLSPFNPNSKNSLVGGEIIALGMDFSIKHFLLKPFAFINTDAQKRGALFQAGLKAGFNFNISNDFLSTTVLQAMYQYWDIVPNGSASSVLVWGDETLRYKNFLFGAGVLGIIGNENSRIYALSDSSKFYGRTMFSQYYAPYFKGGSLSGYVFGGFSMNNRIRVDGMVSFGSYAEYSIVSTFGIWKQDNMKLDVGVGYAYVDAKLLTGNALNAFVKFSY